MKNKANGIKYNEKDKGIRLVRGPLRALGGSSSWVVLLLHPGTAGQVSVCVVVRPQVCVWQWDPPYVGSREYYFAQIKESRFSLGGAAIYGTDQEEFRRHKITLDAYERNIFFRLFYYVRSLPFARRLSASRQAGFL